MWRWVVDIYLVVDVQIAGMSGTFFSKEVRIFNSNNSNVRSNFYDVGGEVVFYDGSLTCTYIPLTHTSPMCSSAPTITHNFCSHHACCIRNHHVVNNVEFLGYDTPILHDKPSQDYVVKVGHGHDTKQLLATLCHRLCVS